MTLSRRSSNSPPSSQTGLQRDRIVTQIPAFAVIGLTGLLVDAGITYASAQNLGLSPELARPPGFIVATIVNFFLNRAITFRHSQASFVRSFVRYWAVAGAGLAVNYAAYLACVLLVVRLGFPVTPPILPLFVAVGSGVAMIVTFIGFRFYAFG